MPRRAHASRVNSLFQLMPHLLIPKTTMQGATTGGMPFAALLLGLSDVYQASRQVSSAAAAISSAAGLTTGVSSSKYAQPDGEEGGGTRQWKPPDQFRRWVRLRLGFRR